MVTTWRGILLEAYKKVSNHRIIWTEPDLLTEVGEYFENEYTKEAFYRKGFVFENKMDLLLFLKNGKLTEINKKDLIKIENISIGLDPESLEDNEYMASYHSMEKDLINGDLVLPAPIIIKFENLYYGFSGNRRMNLAWNNNLPLKVWLVKETYVV